MGPKKKSKDNISLAPCHLAGSMFTKICFSNDSRYLFCGCGSVINVYNATNGERLHNLIGHSSIVTGVAVNASNCLQIFSCSLDGLLISWDYLDGAKLKQHSFHMPLYGIVAMDSQTESIMMIAQPSQHGFPTFDLLQWCKDKDNPSEFAKPKVLIQGCNRDQELVSFGCMNQFAAFAKGVELTVYSMKNGNIRLLKSNNKYDGDITCVACHPTEYCIATGIENGRIIFWYSFLDGQKPMNSMVHWHSLAVLSLDFSPDGSILLSGGHECVLVRWQINNNYQKDFKPRMGAPLTRVMCSPDGNYFATLHADNVIQVMDINLSILQVHRGLSRANWNTTADKNPIPVGLIYDPRSRSLITNGLPGHLQFYSLAHQKQLYNLDIVGQNYISPENLEKPSVVTEVKKATISEDGEWLASFEKWDDDLFTPELRLKFWLYDSSQKMYVLNTVVETPHEKEATSMCFRPAPPPSSHLNPSPTLVTTGADHCFKIWTLIDDTDIYRVNTRWDCDSVGFYKDMRTHCADFSCDGSSLVVAFEHLLTIWDPEKNVVRTSLSNPSADKDIIRAVKFGRNDSRYFVVTITEKFITSWNLLSLTAEWSMDMNSVLLFSDPVLDLMAVMTMDNTLTVFKPQSQKVVYSCPAVSNTPVLDAVFIPNNRPQDICSIGWPGSSQIYLYTANNCLLTFDRDDRVHQLEKVQIHQNLPKSNLSAIMAEKVVKDKDQSEVKETQGKRNMCDDDFIVAMLHTNEPVSAFCDQFLEKLLIKKKHKSRSKKVNEIKIEELEDNMEVTQERNENFMFTENMIDPAYVDFLKEESETSEKKDLEMDKLLSEKPNWAEWCSSLDLS